ncbi:thioesterase [Streptomyces verrucosisporus]|nr:thioesterase [Streptomyces verrucosisporus]
MRGRRIELGSEWFRTYAPAGLASGGTGPRVRLVCFPHAGGSASAFVPFARLLAPVCEVLSVQYPGRQDRRRQEPVPDVGRLAGTIAEEVTRHVPEPYAFFGHSMGAIVAYETARRLRAGGEPAPVRLFLSGRGAPSAEPSPHDGLRTDGELIATAARLGGTAPDLLDDSEVRDMVLPALRADYRALADYRWVPGPRLDVPFTVLVGDSDPVVTVAEAAAWEGFTASGTEFRVFAGGHFYLNDHIDAVGRTITAALAAPGRQPAHAGFPSAGGGARTGSSAAPGDVPSGPGGPWQ